MNLPVSSDYLAKAVQDQCRVKHITLTHKSLGNLLLPTGQLVACDPFVFPESEPFALALPHGAFPVVASVAEIKSDQRLAFASIRFKETPPVAWDMMTEESQDTSKLQEGHFFGYGVDSGTGCFMDKTAARLLDQRMKDNKKFYEVMIAEMEKTYRHTWSWMDMKFDNVNLVAFSSGYGDGGYATYAGFDAEGDVCIVVTDFAVIEDEKK